MTAIHAGITQTGSLPISRIRIACRLKETPHEEQAGDDHRPCHQVGFGGTIAPRHLMEQRRGNRKTDRGHHHSQGNRGKEEMQPAEPCIEAEHETKHGATPLFCGELSTDCFPPDESAMPLAGSWFPTAFRIPEKARRMRQFPPRRIVCLTEETAEDAVSARRTGPHRRRLRLRRPAAAGSAREAAGVGVHLRRTFPEFSRSSRTWCWRFPTCRPTSSPT